MNWKRISFRKTKIRGLGNLVSVSNISCVAENTHEGLVGLEKKVNQGLILFLIQGGLLGIRKISLISPSTKGILSKRGIDIKKGQWAQEHKRTEGNKRCFQESGNHKRERFLSLNPSIYKESREYCQWRSWWRNWCPCKD